MDIVRLLIPLQCYSGARIQSLLTSVTSRRNAAACYESQILLLKPGMQASTMLH
ncbi:hypothetical protein M378DRAFT_162829 [Amanita muscaria Koide BX008]|uniref:Uncharacterized protein n=1 Tax=Amanita muscaria (strain Koide BX008) TaxID=946122 RepID=A0A0C2X7I1_AMAMK|nr:hypothetical protein M378DRAFT_162829 [Amanita muscaria Koide BX008]